MTFHNRGLIRSEEGQNALRLQEAEILPQMVSHTTPKPQGPLEELGVPPGTVAHAYNPGGQEAEVKEWLQVRTQPGLHNENMPQKPAFPADFRPARPQNYEKMHLYVTGQMDTWTVPSVDWLHG